MRARIGYEVGAVDPDDGVFWMSLADFSRFRCTNGIQFQLSPPTLAYPLHPHVPICTRCCFPHTQLPPPFHRHKYLSMVTIAPILWAEPKLS